MRRNRPSRKRTLESHEEFVHLHFQQLDEPARQEPCGLCKPVYERTDGVVCSKCRAVVPRLDRKARRYIYQGLEADQARLFRRLFGNVYGSARPENNIRRRRKQARMTQTDLAKRLGVSQFHVSQLERGKKLPSEQLAARLEKLKI